MCVTDSRVLSEWEKWLTMPIHCTLSWNCEFFLHISLNFFSEFAHRQVAVWCTVSRSYPAMITSIASGFTFRPVFSRVWMVLWNLRRTYLVSFDCSDSCTLLVRLLKVTVVSHKIANDVVRAVTKPVRKSDFGTVESSAGQQICHKSYTSD